MKIIDCDVHIASTPGDRNLTVEELLLEMESAGVSQAVCWPMLNYRREVAEDNTTISKAAKNFPEKIIPFGGVNPMLGIKHTRDEVVRCSDELGMIGIKLNGPRDGYYLDDAKLAIPVYEQIAEKNLALAIHTGMNPSSGHPWRFKKVAQLFPETPMIMVHMGGAGTALYREAIEVALECENVVVAPSEADPKAIVQAIETLGSHRICYASDAPFSMMRVTLAIFNAILDEFDEKEREAVMAGNILRHLSLDR